MALPAILEGKLRIPLIGAPMFIVSGPELVIAQCKAGIVGSFPALNARPESMLHEWLERITGELAEYAASHPDTPVAPFAVNQIVHRSNDRLRHDVDACVRYKVPIIITSLRPPAEVVEAVHAYGGVVFHDVINLRHAEKAIRQGVDGIIAVCAGAGGHAGTTSPFALTKEIRQIFDGTLILAGAMSRGCDLLAARALGADLAYFGTRFIASTEANAPQSYKDMIVQSSAADIVYTPVFTGVHGSYLRGSIENAGIDADRLSETDARSMNFGSGGNSRAKAWRDIWGAGQGVGSIDDIPPVNDLIMRLEREYKDALQLLSLDRLPACSAPPTLGTA
jgi:nitronate monooxygenase